jgi:L-glyceraldehyde 3-phosphate reductase
MENYIADESRYHGMEYNRCGRSGVLLPKVSLGLWHNFGDTGVYANMEEICFTAFDHGITHFDLANNYGPKYGSAESNFGKILKEHFLPYRDELIISTKAGYDMWPGPYGDHGSRKYLIASLNQSLKRMGLDYVDIFYHHRMDPETPLEETMLALDQIVRSGKALYVGISNYGPGETEAAVRELRRLGTPCLIHQPRYSMLDRHIENGLTDVLRREKVGCIVFQPLAGGMLTGKYLDGIPSDSRMARDNRFLKPESLTDDTVKKVRALKEIADARGQKLHQLALQWVLRDEVISSALIGASRPEQILDNAQILSAPPLTEDELRRIDEVLS